MEEAHKVCAARFEAFGSAVQAARIRPVSLDEMAQRYRAGALPPAPGASHRAAR